MNPVVTVAIVSREREVGAKARQKIRITEALRASEGVALAAAGPLGVVPTITGTAYTEMEK